jgi:N-acetylated-alpha-linked acidic dipeptidase
MGGPLAPSDWQGGLPISYRLGGQGRVPHQVVMGTSGLPNYVVEARIRGSELPDEWVVFGNHRDAWEFGGVDPSSGTASMMELTRALGMLLRAGVRPRRTLVFCSWDGEEVGLTGSTEWGEEFADVLKTRMVAYLNVDSSTSGARLDASSVPSLAPMLVEATRSLTDPSGVSLYEAWKTSAGRRRGAPAASDDDLVDTRIGSGSDHTVFLNFLGRPTVLLGFDGDYGVYHSAYDNFYWMNHFGDPGYRYHTLMTQLWGVVGLRLANADVLPFDFALYARNVRAFEAEVAALPGASAHVGFAPLRGAIDGFERAGRELNLRVERALAAPLPAGEAARLNAGLMAVEGNWLHADGIPGRPWFKHVLYAARYTYAHLEVPGLTEAVEASNWELARQQAAILEAALRRNTALLEGLARPSGVH